MQRQAAYEYKVFNYKHHIALVGRWHIKEELCKRFYNFKNKYPKSSNIRAKVMLSSHITLANYLDRHVVLKTDIVHRHQDS